MTWEANGERSKVDFVPIDMVKAVAEEKRWKARRSKTPYEVEEEKKEKVKPTGHTAPHARSFVFWLLRPRLVFVLLAALSFCG